MFASDHCHPHRIPPAGYFESSDFESDLAVLQAGWHVVSTTDALPRSGDFVTFDLLGHPIQLRNFSGKLSALSNVCAHRHCLVSSAASGNSPNMECQYHGWRYKADGSTGKIPQAENFKGVDSSSLCLRNYAIATVGGLIFVSVNPEPPSIGSFLGDEFHDYLTQRFGAGWFTAMQWQPDYDCNWKVPIENSLESYHVPNVHPATFREDPGASRMQHDLAERHTSMTTKLPFSPHNRLDKTFQKLESRFVSWMGVDVTSSYAQHHHFPNLLFSFTDAISLVQCLIPESPNRCRAFVSQFGLSPARERAGLLRNRLSRFWGKLTSAITKKILREDMAMFAAIQTGLEHSPHTGVLGACEERVHHFQETLLHERKLSKHD
jgi:choline monooxygenase